MKASARHLHLLAGIMGLLSVSGSSAAMFHFVAPDNPSSMPPFTNWLTAATNIQDAVDVAVDGDVVCVTNGVYETGGRVVYGATTNRVVIDKAITVRSVNGPACTIIRGKGPQGASAVRCAYVGHCALLAGFTLTDGHTQGTDDYYINSTGGGAWCEADGVISNCVISRNTAYAGGGTFSGTLCECILSTNVALESGGGASYGTLYDCTLTDNISYEYAGGADSSDLSNCVLSGNLAMLNGGGARFSTLRHCSLFGNDAIDCGGGVSDSDLVECELSFNSAHNGGGANGSTMSNCVFIGNAAHLGGGDCAGVLYLCTLSDNRAFNDGGGAYYSSLFSCTLTANVAEGNGGGAVNSEMVACSLSLNRTDGYGGGVLGGTLHNGLVLRNTAENGGGAYGAAMYGSIIAENSADEDGGGADWCTLFNCTVVSNAAYWGGGIMCSTVNSSIVYFNTDHWGSGNYCYEETGWNSHTSMVYSCTTPLHSGPGNIEADPLFVGLGLGDYRLLPISPCVNVGTNDAWMADASDLDGVPRIVGPAVDMGAYEHPLTPSGIPGVWLHIHGLPADGSADLIDSDGDEMNNRSEYAADTDPNDPASRLRIRDLRLEDGMLRIEWQGGESVTQYLDSSTTLAGPWSPIRTISPPTPATNDAFVDELTNTTRFFRLRIHR